FYLRYINAKSWFPNLICGSHIFDENNTNLVHNNFLKIINNFEIVLVNGYNTKVKINVPTYFISDTKQNSDNMFNIDNISIKMNSPNYLFFLCLPGEYNLSGKFYTLPMNKLILDTKYIDLI